MFTLSGPHEARVVRVVDGDTIHCDINMGSLTLANERFTVWTNDRPVRLAGCNAWEKATEAGKAAQANLVALLPPGTPVTLTAGVDGYKYGSTGEVVAGVTVDGTDLVAALIAQQWCAPYTGVGKMTDHVPPWPRTVP